MGPKYPAIDLLKLYTGKLEGFEDNTITPQDFDSGAVNASHSHKMLSSHHKWNNWLDRCFRTGNINELIRVRYGLQVGMDNLVKQKLGSPKIVEMFVRWQGSIEKTARNIIKKRHGINKKIALDFRKAYEEKKRIDHEFENFLKDSSY